MVLFAHNIIDGFAPLQYDGTRLWSRCRSRPFSEVQLYFVLFSLTTRTHSQGPGTASPRGGRDCSGQAYQGLKKPVHLLFMVWYVPVQSLLLAGGSVLV